MENRLSNLPFNEKSINDAWQLIVKSQNITLLTHSQPDADGISACAALSALLEKHGKTIESIYPTKSAYNLKRHPKNLKISTHEQIPDLLIACDTATYERLYYPPAFHDIPLINIDHHISNRIQGTYNFVQPQTSSACEVLTGLIMKWVPEEITSYIAQCLLMGILYDTQIFRLPSVTAKTLRLAAFLVEKGGDIHSLTNELISNKNPSIITLWGDMMKNIRITPSKKTAWSKITQNELKEYQLELSSLVGFNNFLAQITDIDVTLLFYETETGETKVSLRSKVTDVNELARQFGGGGHKHAAGILSNLPLDQLVEKITQKL